MKRWMHLVGFLIKRRGKDSFTIGYNVVFPMAMVLLLGYLMKGSYGTYISSYQYYSYVMLPFCVLIAVISAAYAAKEEAFTNTAIRFVMAPLSKREIVMAKIASATVVYSACYSVVLVVLNLMFKLSLGIHILAVIGLLWVECFFAVSLGIFIGIGMKNFILVKNILNLPIMVFAILGGCFFPIGTLNRWLDKVFWISPLTWVNRGIFLLVYDEQNMLIGITAIMLLLLGSVIGIAAMKCFKKEEFLHGELPSYEK